MEEKQKEEIIKEIQGIQMNSSEEAANFIKAKRLLFKYLIFLTIIFALVGSSFWIGFKEGKDKGYNQENKTLSIDQIIVENKFPNDDQNIDFALFWKVWDVLKAKYVDKSSLNAQELVYGAIKGMLRATGDPYSNFFDPEETESFNEDLEGTFEGIGAELGIKDNVLTIIAPLENSPAQRSGLRAGDKIVKIDEKSTSDLNIYEAVDLIRGPKGTAIMLTVFHEGAKETQEVSIVRDTIEVKSVKLEFKEGDIAYLEINKFGEETANEFDGAMKEIIVKNSKGLILDLRNNPGGLLDRAVKIADRLIAKGQVVVIEENGLGERESMKTAGGDKLSQLPLVVLINEGSASASEILAGALRDNRKIKLIGQKSFGKGSVQEFVKLPGESSAKITIAKWLTPNGEYIMDRGISPDIEVDLTAENYDRDEDPQLERALEIIKEEISK